MSPRSIALLIGGVFEAAAAVFYIAADDPYMAFMLAITGVGMCTMSFILLHAMTRGDGTKHAELPAWKPIARGAKSALGTKAPAGVHLPPPSLLPIGICAGAAIAFFGIAMNLPFLFVGAVLLGAALVGWLIDSGREWYHQARGAEIGTPLRAPRLLIDAVAIAFFSIAIGMSGLFSASAQGGGTDPSAPPADLGHPTLSAKGVKFDLAKFAVKAGEAAELTFHNEDAGVPHNVAVVAADGTKVFSGEKISGDATVTYEIPALKEGAKYTFICEVHANMKGEIDVLP
ncbi:MAG: hypothetical protein RIR19_108 [Chloroflexota bacterium]|jgi:plastocyanin